jgi:hypothetical protein
VSPVKYELGFYIPEDDTLQFIESLAKKDSVLPLSIRKEDWKGPPPLPSVKWAGVGVRRY